ncbi:hypothetical protein EMCRGX_G016970 [Ephydatia muelleri]
MPTLRDPIAHGVLKRHIYSDSVSLLKSRNLSTAYTNLNVLDTELGKETTAGWIINDPIKKEDISAHYSSVNDAVALLSQYNEGKDQPESCLPPDSSTNCGLGAPGHGQDTCLQFGLHSALSLFNNYANALHWIMASNYGAQLLHYLDDFLLVGPSGKDTCQEAMYRMLLPRWCLFLRYLIDLVHTVKKLHHHISLNALARADIMWWDSFLPSWNGVAMFLEPEKTEADSLQLFTNALGSLGFGNGGWFQAVWQPHQFLPLCTIQWRNCSPLWLLPAHGIPSGLGYASSSLLTTSPFPGLVKTVHEIAGIHATALNPVLCGSLA